MYKFSFKRRVTYGETDMMGYMYYGNYAEWYEIGRVETMRSLGLSYKLMESEHNIMMPVVHVESRFMHPARYDEHLDILTIIPELPGRLAVFDSEIYNEEKVLIHKASVKLVFVQMDTQKRTTCPKYLLDKLMPYFDK